jgi:hypothetical protein
MNQENLEELLTTTQAARLLGAAPSSLKQSRTIGTLFGQAAPPFLKLGQRSIRYKLSALIEFRDQFPEYNNTSEY